MKTPTLTDINKRIELLTNERDSARVERNFYMGKLAAKKGGHENAKKGRSIFSDSRKRTIKS